MKIYAITNQKGGVGKTTTTVNLASSLAARGKRVLLVDLDPQGNATTGSGVDKRAVTTTLYQLLLGSASFEAVRITTEFKFDILPSNHALAGAEVELIEVEQREFRLRNALQDKDYDYVLIDCPPALNLLTVNGLVAADAVVIPMQCEYYAMEGLADLVATLRKIRGNLNPRLEIEGLLRTMFNPQSGLTQQVSAELEQHFGNKVYKTLIPRNVRLAEAPSFGRPALNFDRASRGAVAYLALADEILARAGETVGEKHET